MKKVLFVTKYPFHVEYSIKRKFDSQMRAVKNMGHDVYHTAFDKECCYLVHNGQKTPIKKIALSSMPGYIHTKAYMDMFDTVLRVLKKERFDIAYIRLCELTCLGYLMIKKLARSGTKIVVEIPTYPAEKEALGSVFYRLCRVYINYWWRKAEPYCDLFTLIGEKADSYHGRPAINISNGISTEDIPLRKHQTASDGKLHILALASMCNWHAYDRLIEGIDRMEPERRQRIILDLAGAGGDGSLAKWKALTEEKQLQECVRFHGYVSGDALDQMINTASIGVGTLGLYRNNFAGGSILKIREYMARGLPFVYAGDDSALAGTEPYCLKVPNDETPVNMDKVLSFAVEMENNPQYCEMMREHVREKMSWEQQFETVFSTVEKSGAHADG